MSINNSNSNKFDNPKYLELSDTLNDKYAEKEAYEESDIIAWTRMLFVTIHLIIGCGSVALIQFLELSKLEKLALTAFVFVIAIAIEWFKGVYMERYFIALLKTQDSEQPKQIRVLAQKRKGTNFNILLVFWLVSMAIFSISGSQLAKKTYGVASTLIYDINIENTLIVATNTLNKATKEGAGAGTLRNLSQKVADARLSWENHKANIDIKNEAVKSSHSEEIFNYAVFAFIFCCLLEIALFAARGFHETKQYEIHKSLNGVQLEKYNDNHSHYKSDVPCTLCAARLVEIKELKQAIEWQNQAFDNLKERTTSVKPTLNGSHSKS